MPFGPLLAGFLFVVLCLRDEILKAEAKAKPKGDDKPKENAKGGRRSYDP
jgi:hypothetical protein